MVLIKESAKPSASVCPELIQNMKRQAVWQKLWCRNAPRKVKDEDLAFGGEQKKGLFSPTPIKASSAGLLAGEVSSSCSFRQRLPLSHKIICHWAFNFLLCLWKLGKKTPIILGKCTSLSLSLFRLLAPVVLKDYWGLCWRGFSHGTSPLLTTGTPASLAYRILAKVPK